MEDKKEIKEKKHDQWKEEKHIEFPTIMGKVLRINRIRYIGEGADPNNPKRCISLTKNRKSVAFDIENARAVEAAIRILSKDHVPKEVS